MRQSNLNTLDPETQVFVLEQTIESMEKLISKREVWLNKPENKKRTTFLAVLRDTRDMREKIEDLRDKLKEYNSNN
jgi:hypothetical protein